MLTVVISPVGAEAVSQSGLIISLWLLFGFALTLVEQLGWRALFGPGGDALVGRFTARLWTTLKEDPGGQTDRHRVTLLLASIVGISLFLVLSVFWVRYLVLYRHGAVLIAVATVVGQVIIGLGSALCATAVFHRMRPLLSMLPPGGRLSRLLTLRSLLGIAAGGAVLGLVAMSILAFDTMVALDAFSFLLVGVALLARPLGPHFFPHRWLRQWHVVALPILALTGMAVTSHSEQGRQLVVSQSMTSKYLYAVVRTLSDFDRDGSSSFPFPADCAPFNGDIHPRATEIPGNGVDEDCDGLDVAVGHYAPQRTRAKLDDRLKRNLVLLTLDATRSDHMGFMGYERNTTPNLDRFAQRSTIFTAAFSQDSGTGPSLWSLMTGKTPFQARLENADRFPPQLAASERTLAEQLQSKGYDTVALLCGDVFGVKKEKKSWNIRRGFRVFREVCGRKGSMQAELVTKRAMTELKRLRKAKKPFFLWVHYLDPHHPYTQHPSDLFGPTKLDGYDEEIHYTDHELGPLLRELSRGKDQPWVAITADHGENFGEHGTSPHARTLYREVTHVPLVIRAPHNLGRQVDAPVAVGDIHATFLELAAIAHPAGVTMVSQAAVVLGSEAADEGRLVFQENSYSRPRRDAKALVGPRYHLIWDSTNDIYEFYDWVADPAEKDNLAGQGVERERELRQVLKNFARSTHVPKDLAK